MSFIFSLIIGLMVTTATVATFVLVPVIEWVEKNSNPRSVLPNGGRYKTTDLGILIMVMVVAGHWGFILMPKASLWWADVLGNGWYGHSMPISYLVQTWVVMGWWLYWSSWRLNRKPSLPQDEPANDDDYYFIT